MLLVCWMLVGTCMMFQYQREKEFRTRLLNTELQMHNSRILSDLRQGDKIDDIARRIGRPVDELRITLIDSVGHVIFDNNSGTKIPTSNHNTRSEIISARANGSGYTVERLSESDGIDYFYSARLGDDGTVIRSAAPYNHSLQEFLRADRTLLWIMAIITLVMSLIGYLVTRKISLSITRLNRFAERAEKGERIYSDEAFPHDELGSIASHIVRLYVQRDQQHREAMRQEQDKIRLKKQLTNNINHELKTPVASMLVCLELLRDHPELPEDKKRQFNDRIMTNARRLSALLEDVSEITRLDEGAEVIDKCSVDLTGLVCEVVAEEQLRTDICISIDMPSLTVNGNRQLLESVFRNLIDNSIAYSGATRITITADAEGHVTVRDNGCGIAEEHLPHIFERFYRIDKGRSRAAGGTGLGLAIVRNAIAIHGGVITARNDGGLRFDFRLKPQLQDDTFLTKTQHSRNISEISYPEICCRNKLS